MRRDLNDPKTIEETAARVGDVRRLAMLHLLTRADSLATGPEAWSSFRSSLVRELYVRTRDFLEGAPVREAASASSASAAVRRARLSPRRCVRLDRSDAGVVGGEHRCRCGRPADRAAARCRSDRTRSAPASTTRTKRTSSSSSRTTVRVCSRSSPACSRCAGFDVHDAEIYTRSDGIAVEVFRVDRHTTGPSRTSGGRRIRADIAAALARRRSTSTPSCTKKSAQTRRRREQRRRDGAQREVVVDNDGLGREHGRRGAHAGPARPAAAHHEDARRMPAATCRSRRSRRTACRSWTCSTSATSRDGRSTDPEHIERIERCARVRARSRTELRSAS